MTDLQDVVAEKRGWFIALGVVLILLGPRFYRLSAAHDDYGKDLSGLVIPYRRPHRGCAGFLDAHWSGFLWNLLIGLLYVVVGGWLAFFPLAGLLGLTVLVAFNVHRRRRHEGRSLVSVWTKGVSGLSSAALSRSSSASCCLQTCPAVHFGRSAAGWHQFPVFRYCLHHDRAERQQVDCRSRLKADAIRTYGHEGACVGGSFMPCKD